MEKNESQCSLLIGAPFDQSMTAISSRLMKSFELKLRTRMPKGFRGGVVDAAPFPPQEVHIARDHQQGLRSLDR